MWVRAVSCKQEDLSSYPLHLHKSQVRPHPGSPSVGGLRQLDPGNSLVSEPRHNRELQVQCESSSQKRKAGSSRGGRAQAASSSTHTLSVDDFYRLVGQPLPHSKIKANPGYRRPYPRKGGGEREGGGRGSWFWGDGATSPYFPHSKPPPRRSSWPFS